MQLSLVQCRVRRCDPSSNFSPGEKKARGDALAPSLEVLLESRYLDAQTLSFIPYRGAGSGEGTRSQAAFGEGEGEADETHAI